MVLFVGKTDENKEEMIDKYDNLIAHGDAIGEEYRGLYWIIELNKKGNVRETLFNKHTGQIVIEKYK